MIRTDAGALSELVAEIQAGRCVAFVGAGFSAPVCRSWPDLIRTIAAKAPAPAREHVEALLSNNDGASYEIAAQILEDAFAEDPSAKLLDVVRRHTRREGATKEDQAKMARRKEMLEGIPFAAILTTNFDDVLRGDVLDRETYGLLVREADRRWVETHFWKKSGARVLKLHGDLRGEKGITLSRRGYRTRLYAEPGYLNVLRTVFLTKTILFIGFSFNDAYLNELRSEALSYLGKRSQALAYAVLPDVPEAIRSHYEKHEGIHVFSYESATGKGHGHVDEFLESVHKQTHPPTVMGPRLHGRKILWVDPSEQNNERGYRFLREAANGLCTVEVARTPDAALERLSAESYDLVITRWGHHNSRPPDAVSLLTGMRASDHRVPVVIFASGAFADVNRDAALRLGALEYTSDWETLFEVIDRRFGAPP